MSATFVQAVGPTVRLPIRRPGDGRAPSGGWVAPLVILAAAGLLALCAALPGVGRFGPQQVIAPQVRAGAGVLLVDASAAVGLALPGTGGALVGTSASAGAAPATTPGALAPVLGAGSSACTGPCSTAQVVSVSILPGPLTVSHAPRAVEVAIGEEGVGTVTLSGVEVTDLRGAAAGWALTARVAAVLDPSGRAVPGATVETIPRCTRTAGPLTLESADPGVVAPGGTLTLCRVPIASSGSLAGGLVSAAADLRVRGAPAGSSVRVVLDTTVG